MDDNITQSIEEAARHPKNLGEMEAADAVGTAGRSDCGDMLRMWVKFREENGRRVIDRATFQSFGCQTAIAVASIATEMIRGKTAEEALALKGDDLSTPLGPLPPMKIHCAQLVEEALRSTLDSTAGTGPLGRSPTDISGPTLADQLVHKGKVKITLLPKDDNS